MNRIRKLLATTLTGLILGLLVLTGSPSGNASAGPATPADVVSLVVRAESRHQWNEVAGYWVSQLRPSIASFLADPGSQRNFEGYHNIISADVVELKELPLEAARPFVSLPKYLARYGDARIFYAGITYRVHRETKYYYNGVNYRLVTLVPEDGQWRIVEMSDAPVDALAEAGHGFASEAEGVAMKIHKARYQGLFLNPAGHVIEKFGATAPGSGDNSSGDVTVQHTRTRPADIRVRLTWQVNLDWYGCSSYCTRTIDFDTYQRNVLPNEWISTWPMKSLKVGAMAVKMYGWYHVIHPKWPSVNADVYDNTNDQVFKRGTAITSTTDAFGAIAGIGIETAGSHKLFETQYLAGDYGTGGWHDGKVWQWGSKYWADQGTKTYEEILQYYYNQSPNTGGENINFFNH